MLAPAARPVRLRKKGFHVMAANDQSENGSHSQPEPPSHGEQAAGNLSPADPAAPQSLGTSDQAIRGGSGYHPEWRNQPDASMVVETDRIRQLQPGANPGVYIVPFAEKPADEQLESGKRGQSKDAQDQGDKPKSNQAKKQDRESKPKDEGNNEDSEDEKNKQGHDEHKGGQSKELPSTMRTLMFSGIVALVAGLVGTSVTRISLARTNRPSPAIRVRPARAPVSPTPNRANPILVQARNPDRAPGLVRGLDRDRGQAPLQGQDQDRAPPADRFAAAGNR